MDILKLKSDFFRSRGNSEGCANELRDYASKLYLQNDITVTEFRQLIRDLEAEGATVPESADEKLLT
ncbi:YppF family protein [Bacillus sp. FJAT-27445]|uniref:YppF family protein n=1 Tax=Bacillus sp. FJAT-27445 TaxID=1679166 RepID=UPI000744279C|nr:YppF family protein [Bacillus sp. FJAT-27445]